jgi:catechol 2,3-dioxygenase-like lactoylglutathione lyase family enzyme
MLAQSDLIAFLATVWPARARAFYQDALGLSFIEESPYALVFDAGGLMLRIQKVEAFEPAAHTALGWRVADIGAVMADLATRGVRFEFYAGLPQDGRGVWTTPDGTEIAWFKDPDANVLSLTRFP